MRLVVCMEHFKPAETQACAALPTSCVCVCHVGCSPRALLANPKSNPPTKNGAAHIAGGTMRWGCGEAGRLFPPTLLVPAVGSMLAQLVRTKGSLCAGEKAGLGVFHVGEMQPPPVPFVGLAGVVAGEAEHPVIILLPPPSPCSTRSWHDLGWRGLGSGGKPSGGLPAARPRLPCAPPLPCAAAVVGQPSRKPTMRPPCPIPPCALRLNCRASLLVVCPWRSARACARPAAAAVPPARWILASRRPSTSCSWALAVSWPSSSTATEMTSPLRTAFSASVG